MTADFFQNLTRWQVSRNGTTAQLPFCYADLSQLLAVYTASTAKVRPLIPHPDLHPLELLPGRCLVAFSAFEYRRTDAEPYNELSISFLVSHRKRPLPLLSALQAIRRRVTASWIWQLAVNTEPARAGGVDLFGFPKFMAEIEFTRSSESLACSFSTSAVEVLHMTGKVLPTMPGRPWRYVSYTLCAGNLLMANTLIHPLETAASNRKGDFQLEIGGQGPICEALRTLDLSPQPYTYQYTPRAEMILFPARNVQDE